jgi:hypothetical protein
MVDNRSSLSGAKGERGLPKIATIVFSLFTGCRTFSIILLCYRYDVLVEPTTGLGVPHVPEETIQTFRQHLNSYNDWALVGELLYSK